MNSKPVPDWRAVLLALASTGAAVLAVAATIIVALYPAVLAAAGVPEERALIQAALQAGAVLFVGTLMIPAAYYSWQRLMSRTVAPSATRPMSPGAGLLILCLWTGAAALAQLFYRNPILRWATPCFYLAAVALPVYFFARLATGGLNFGSRQRTWGALGSGLLLGPLLAGGIELALVAVLVLAFAAFSALRPDLSGGLDFLREQLRNASQTDILDLLTRDLLNPIVISLVVLGFCVAGPLVEESAKSLTAWAVFDRLASPAEGFVVGALSGTGFGLVESLLASVQPDAHWAGTLLVRGATAMMHIATSGLTGWGIATFRTSGQARHLVRGYALAFALHGLWNLCVIAVVLAALHAQVAPGSEQFLDGMLVAAGISILALILLAAAFALGLANRRLRAAARIDQPGTQEVE